MARKLRVEYPGALYHILNRGDRREAIFLDDHDRRRFLDTLGETCAKTGWHVHAWCLMGNHFHLVVETPKANLVAGMKWLLGVYTGRFNRRHKVFGHLFSGRYKALMVDGKPGYLKTVCDYVHLNPVRSDLIAPDQPLTSFPWSSYLDYLRGPQKRPSWLRVGRLLGEHGIPKDSAAGRLELERRMEQRRIENKPGQWKAVRRGWCLGDKKFRQELLGQMKAQRTEHHYGEEAQETDAEHAEARVQEEMKKRKWKEEELTRRRKGDPEKAEMARCLRQETTMTLKWLAARLRMGTAGSLANILRSCKQR